MDGWMDKWIYFRAGEKKKGSVGQQAGRNKGRDEGYIYIYMYMIYDTNRMLEMEMPLFFFSKIKKIRWGPWGRGRLLGQSVARVYFDSMAWHAYIHNIT